jgi:serine/alanine adding enzyme
VTPVACAEVEPERWDEALRAAGVTDAYYARGYVADVTTPYGYGGPVGSGADPPLAAFPGAYETWCGRRGVVSSFVVFHPLAHATAPFRRTALAGTVAWDLTTTELLPAMHKHHRRLVRRAQRAGYDVAIERRAGDLSDFVAIYERTMERQRAAPFYFFPPAYWQALARYVPLVRVEVRDGGALIASVLGMGERPWLHYHLGAAADAARGTGASHLALYELARWGQEHGFATLHLGGGVGGRADSLLEYKLRFAPGGLIGSAIGKAVHDEAAYLRLSGQAAIDWDGFFPAYRVSRRA